VGGAGLVIGLVAARVAGGVYLRDFLDRLDLPILVHPAGLALAVFGMLAAGPLAEEIVFRGLLYPVLRARVGVPAATILQAGIFAACHLGIGFDAPFIVLPYVFGIGAAILAERTGSLAPALILHVLGNAVGLLVVGLVMSAPATVYSLLGGR
jgi:membrane protease YdiL (CAAX protease family)